MTDSSRPAGRSFRPPGSGRQILILAALTGGLFLAAGLALSLGRQDLTLMEVWKLVWQKITGQAADPAYRQTEVVLFLIRLPRILMAFLVGAALSAAGAAYQALFRNPMVAPDILGVSSGAGVGASLAILLGMPALGLYLTAFVFGLGAVLLVLAVTRIAGHGKSLLVLILVGVVVSSLFGALGSFIKYLSADDQTMTSMVLWLMGSFSRSGAWSSIGVMSLALVLGGGPLFLARWQINALAFGEEEAQALGVNFQKLKILIILTSTLLTASSVALCGLIGWVGLIIPHLVRFAAGPNFGQLLPASMLGGGLFMLICDSFVRIGLPGEMPVGIVTSLLGAPLFIYILCRGRKVWI
ncbi:MAG: iron ABC transporter permease [Deltaproteobacteria bacterium]|jgi:iron complex transport system permease protein|nr:iron ABC transporter permease [Deltaproteobacteria bacterium]